MFETLFPRGLRHMHSCGVYEHMPIVTDCHNLPGSFGGSPKRGHTSLAFTALHWQILKQGNGLVPANNLSTCTHYPYLKIYPRFL